MTIRAKGFGVENMVIADTNKDTEPKVTTTCMDCHYNVYRMLGEEAQKLRKPDDCGEHYYPFSQNGKIIEVVTYIQCAYRDGYRHGYKDGYKRGFDDGYKEGRQDAELTEEQAIAFLQESGWLENHDAELGRQALIFAHEEVEDKVNVKLGKLEKRLKVLASIKDLCNSLESEE